MKLAALVTALLAALSGVVSTVLLTKGGENVPWEMQSYGGNSDPERTFKAERRALARRGMAFLALAFILSATSAIMSYFS